MFYYVLLFKLYDDVFVFCVIYNVSTSLHACPPPVVCIQHKTPKLCIKVFIYYPLEERGEEMILLYYFGSHSQQSGASARERSFLCV